MKKFFAITMAVILFAPLSANAGMIQGSSKSCKYGSVKTDSVYKYVCVAPGVWKKSSIQTKKPVVPTVTTPAKIETTTTEVQPTAVKIEPSLTLDNLIPSLVFSKSRESIQKIINSSTYELSGVNFNVGPSVDKSKVDIEKQTIANTAKLWSNIYKPNNNVQVIFYNYADLDWAKSKALEISPSASIYSANSCSVNYCGNASAGQLSNGVWLYEEGLGGGLRNRSTSAHEYTHLAQASVSSQYWNEAPLWLVEGMAQFYGEAVGYTPFDKSNVTRTQHHQGLAYDYYLGSGQTIKSVLEQKNIQSTTALMQFIEFPSPRNTQATLGAAYLVGAYATEVLVAVYGHESMEKFVSSFSTSKDWQLNFKNAFGISKDDFYGKITIYLAEVSKEL